MLKLWYIDSVSVRDCLDSSVNHKTAKDKTIYLPWASVSACARKNKIAALINWF